MKGMPCTLFTDQCKSRCHSGLTFAVHYLKGEFVTHILKYDLTSKWLVVVFYKNRHI